MRGKKTIHSIFSRKNRNGDLRNAARIAATVGKGAEPRRINVFHERAALCPLNSTTNRRHRGCVRLLFTRWHKRSKLQFLTSTGSRRAATCMPGCTLRSVPVCCKGRAIEDSSSSCGSKHRREKLRKSKICGPKAAIFPSRHSPSKV